MKEGWTRRWKALLIWLCGYLSIIAFAITGGYVIVKSEDEELKKTAKAVMIVTLIFTAFSMLFSLINAFGSMSQNYLASDFYAFYRIFTQIVAIAKIIVFAVCGAVSFFKGDKNKKIALPEEDKQATTEEETKNV